MNNGTTHIDRTEAVFLTKSQINNLIEFIDLYFIDSVRDDEDMDNMDYIVDMADVYKELKNSYERIENNEKTN